ncbi:Pyridoxal phosphate (PLP)-dependent transferases superfamily protein [Striga hermonthica]|uniref:Pyridoxal phosphate (PLP)-dependent transferases superfamily protein n=1 Tax=Striga hermonthica TaxID=68872 RepID=A0A9N7NN69_STRHE|nr:Pyridoxal phosphate (PLP)-dependent transferases superfamily protein [Striga hermonthica]
MHSSPGQKQTAKLWLRGCCPNPVSKPPPEHENDHPGRNLTSTSAAACRREFAASTTSSLFPNTHFTNHESIPTLQESFVEFIKTYPKYSDTAPIDRIRAREYSHLSLSDHVCLDYIGIGLFSQSQVKSQYASIIPKQKRASQPDYALFGVNFKPVSLKSQLLHCHGRDGYELELAIEKRVADFLNLSRDEYSMVFTANKSAAYRLVAESYPFQTNRKLLTVYDHESEAVNALTNVSERRGARVMSAEFKWPRLRINSAGLKKMLVRNKYGKKEKKRGLFVFPLQSVLSGASYSYQWMKKAREHGWHVLLDACSLGPKDMDSFGLSLFRPDFLVCSFYRVFGENPTGFGCLFVKKSIVPILLESSSACGGIVSITPPRNILFLPDDSSSSGAGTEIEINREDIECRCLDHVDSLGLMLVGCRGRYLINWLVSALMKLQHPNRLENFPLVAIYGPKVKFDRGPALAFNIYDWKGEKVEPVLVQKLADRSNISVGHGVMSHIWFGEKSEEAKRVVLERCGEGDSENGSGRSGKGGVGIKVVSVALSFLANFEDVYRLWAFVARFLDADFVEKERWRYTALNEKTIEVNIPVAREEEQALGGDRFRDHRRSDAGFALGGDRKEGDTLEAPRFHERRPTGVDFETRCDRKDQRPAVDFGDGGYRGCWPRDRWSTSADLGVPKGRTPFWSYRFDAPWPRHPKRPATTFEGFSGGFRARDLRREDGGRGATWDGDGRCVTE